ncbi:hypothetical protein XMD420_002148 [Marinobacterium sp. xm-d-420]|nr:hypothetical protein [Marinobacterium sp. xm-d-420]
MHHFPAAAVYLTAQTVKPVMENLGQCKNQTRPNLIKTYG